MSGLGHYARTAGNYEAMDLQRTSDFQAALLGMAGHDLRQPLQVIQSAYEWLGSRVAHTSEKARLARGERAIARLTEQLDRLVSALRLYEHTQRMEISPVALAPLLWRIVKENESDALENGIELRVHATRAMVMSNSVLLEGILRNLVRNAVKYTETGGRILIRCRRVKDDIRIDVYDTGVGIAPEHLPQIFDAFQRVDSTRTDGLGIGLFVVRRAVQLLGHRVDVRSRVGLGSRFSVFAKQRRLTRACRLPRHASPIPKFDPRADCQRGIGMEPCCHTKGSAPMPQQTVETAVVHVVDDDESLRRAVDSLCRSVGLQTRTYGSAQEFLDAKPEDIAGCLVLDVRLPGMSGLDFQSQLAALGIHLPVVLVTGHGDIPMSVRAMKAGAVDFLAKPFRDQDLLDAVTTAIKRDRRRREVDGGANVLRDRFLTLSPREQQVMMLVTTGKMNKQVAGDLGLSEITVKIHRAAAMRKMGARTLADLVRMADTLKPESP